MRLKIHVMYYTKNGARSEQAHSTVNVRDTFAKID